MSYRIRVILLALLTAMLTEFYTTGALPEETPQISEEVQAVELKSIESTQINSEVQESEVTTVMEDMPESENEIQPIEPEIIEEKPLVEGHSVMETYTMIATAYGCVEMGGGSWSRTRMGTVPTEGWTIAVDPSIIPLGSLVYVECPSYPQINGVKLAEDTGGAIKGHKVDVYFDDVNRDSKVAEKQMIEFGRREIKVYLLSKN